MYNPARAEGKLHTRRRVYDPHAGLKHSDIVRKAGVGTSAPELAKREKTNHGYSANVFSGFKFVVRHEVVYAGNSIGFGVNNKGDRVFFVRLGVLFATVELPDGSRTVFPVTQGTCFRAPKGTKYGYATSGTSDLEMDVIETPNYSDSWEVIGEATTRMTVEPVLAAPDVTLPTRRKLASKAKDQAISMAVEQQQLRRRQTKGIAKSFNPNSGTQVGVNLKPMGPNIDGND